MAYSGRYRVKNIRKYAGNPSKIKYRSLWERQVMRWLDDNDSVLRWNSEEVIIGYKCKTDNRLHRYFVDLYIQMKDGKEYLIEIKPKKQTMPPKQPTRKTKKYLNEVLTYGKNISKWEAAKEYAHKRDMIFQVWTEDTIKGLGIKLIT
tara:strand:- start:909 stop:1352 length:444 start_codon:yes stop_codon:yes gene_type:complete